MSWVFLDDDFHEHPKILAVGNAGAGVFARALSYCGRYSTDGFIPQGWMKRACGGEVRARILREKLLVEVAGGYMIPDYLENNPSREDVEEKRRKWRERQQKLRDKRRAESLGLSPVTPGGTGEMSPRDSQDPPSPTPEVQVLELPNLRVRAVDLEQDAELIDLTAEARKKTHPDRLDNRYRKRDGTATYTGCRQTRGQGGFGHVYDPLGIDYPPADWPHKPPSREEISLALQERRSA